MQSYVRRAFPFFFSTRSWSRLFRTASWRAGPYILRRVLVLVVRGDRSGVGARGPPKLGPRDRMAPSQTRRKVTPTAAVYSAKPCSRKVSWARSATRADKQKSAREGQSPSPWAHNGNQSEMPQWPQQWLGRSFSNEDDADGGRSTTFELHDNFGWPFNSH